MKVDTVEPAVVSMLNASRRYRRGRQVGAREWVHALDGLSLEVRAGEILAVVGPSGSGKSTLARCLAFLESPDEGEMRFRGQAVRWDDRSAMRSLRRRVQLVFQDPVRAVNPRFTAEEVLAEPQRVGVGRSQTPPFKQDDGLQLLSEVHLDPSVLPIRARSLSGGQLQRLVLARALVTQPEVLVLDETFSGLDLSLQAKLVNLVLDLVERRALTFVLITHNPDLAGQLADRTIVLSRGRVSDEIFAFDPTSAGVDS